MAMASDNADRSGLSVQPETQADTLESAEAAAQAQQYTGSIRVHVTTARGARPVPGATVIIAREEPNGTEDLMSLQVTGQSGEIANVVVPSPPPSADQRNPISYRYDVSVYAAGYYRENSKNVPVFPNIVSVQNFDLIPLPAGVDDPQTAGDLTFYNPMPRF